ncbi:MAG: hypothetical protein ACLUEQ_08720 [Cloacibacillus evryensis]
MDQTRDPARQRRRRPSKAFYIPEERKPAGHDDIHLADERPHPPGLPVGIIDTDENKEGYTEMKPAPERI